MTDEDALLAAIIAHPDDTPRLIYADWLDEHGQPDRAEFIRVQIERDRLTPTDPRYATLARREATLFGRHRRDWPAAVQAVLPGAAVKFRRGFAEELTAPAAVLLANAAEVWELAPLRRVTATRSVVVIPDLSELPRPPHVRLTAELGNDERRAALFPLDLLRPDPPELEPWLREGQWLVLGWPESGPGRRAVTQFAELIRRRGRRGFGFGAFGLAARPLRENDDPRTWCPVPVPTGELNWLLFRDGAVVSHQVGAAQLANVGEAFWEPVGGPSWIFR